MKPRAPGRVQAAVQRGTMVALALALTLAPLDAVGQSKGKRPLPEDVLPMSELEDDPIGVDRRSRALDKVPRERQPDDAAAVAERARFGPLPPKLTAKGGEVMTSTQSVRELQHRVQVAFATGLATVDVEMVFENRSKRPSELEYRLAVPAGAGLASLEVCNARGCREGLVERTAAGAQGAYDASVLARGADEPLPIAHARLIRDRRGRAIKVRAAPVAKGDDLTVRLQYVTPLPQHGGEAHLMLPARGMDARVAPSEVHLSPGPLSDPRIGRAPVTGAPALLDPWTPVGLHARARAGTAVRREVVHYRCGERRCVRAHVAAAPGKPQPRDLVIALDVSPSTEGPARGRLLAAVAAILEQAPPGSRVRALAFAGRAEVLVPDALEPSGVSLRPFARAIAQAELGSATRFEAVWEHAGPWLRGTRKQRRARPLIVLVGDGGLTTGDARAFERARRAGVEVSAVNLAKRATVPELLERVYRTGGVSVAAGAALDALGEERVDGLIGALFAPTVARRVEVVGAPRVLGPLRAGESLTWEGPVRGSGALRVGARRSSARKAKAGPARALASARALSRNEPVAALAAVDRRDLARPQRDWPKTRPGHKRCDRRGPARRHGGISSDARPVAVARERVCKVAATPKVGTAGEIGVGMPEEPLLQMLRRRIMPVARGCFRRDRAGRASYDRRAVFAFTLADREVVDARVQGRIPQPLRECLLSAVDTLDVPRFSGIVKVRYPLVTESVPQPSQVDLSSGTAGEVDALFGREPIR